MAAVDDGTDFGTASVGDPLPGLTPAELAAFNRGRVVFRRNFTPNQGLGPAFNASSCAECHGEGELDGGTGDEVETHFSNVRSDGTCDLLERFGGQVHQDSVTPRLRNATGKTSEPFPNVTHTRGTRITPDIFGFGLINAVSNLAIEALADPNDANDDGISGRVHRTANGDVGKFGRKANDGDLLNFNAGAFLAEMGITNRLNQEEMNFGGKPLPHGVDPAADPELSNQDLDDTQAFVRFLAPAPRTPLTNQTREGRDLFSSIGCTGCHVPSLPTVSTVPPALANKRVSAFSDFLLHDLGSSNADMCNGNARTAEFRTEPLMGANLMEVFMHDGSTTTITGAVSGHGGEGSRSRTKFFNLNSAQRAAVVAYVRSL